jgi:hypothetical protein
LTLRGVKRNEVTAPPPCRHDPQAKPRRPERAVSRSSARCACIASRRRSTITVDGRRDRSG